MFAIWQGGLGIWGGIAGGVAGGWYVLHKRLPAGQRAQFMDVAVPGLLVAQAIGRIGDYFNQEPFGAPSNLPWALQIAAVHRPAGYLAFRTFEPTFLYELIWDLLLAGFLGWLGTRRRVRAPGLFALYVAGYSGFRVFEETQRIDFSNYLLEMRVNFWIASALCLLGLVAFAAIQNRWRGMSISPARTVPEGQLLRVAGRIRTSALTEPRTRRPLPQQQRTRTSPIGRLTRRADRRT